MPFQIVRNSVRDCYLNAFLNSAKDETASEVDLAKVAGGDCLGYTQNDTCAFCVTQDSYCG
ncbi:MAG: hypothetical protein K6E53_11020 [Lachnospiraceae bacterium]|nr:hypothetical protein [Lachnospiraceae bacterium]